MATHPAPKLVGPRDGKAGSLGSIGVRFMIDAEETHDGGFEDYFDEIVGAGLGDAPPDPAWIAGLAARYGLEHDLESIPVLCERFGLTFAAALG